MDDKTTKALQTFSESVLKSKHLTRLTKAHELLGALGILYTLDLLGDEEFMRMSKACINNIKNY